MVRLTIEQKEDIVNAYLSDISNTCASLGRKHNVDYKTIKYTLKKHNVKIRNDISRIKRKYTLNESFFEKIDTEEKAYFLGFLYADGYLNYKHKILGISLQERDKDILEKLRIIIGSSKPLVFREWISKHPTWQNSYVLEVYGIKICEDVIKLGCVPKKSLILQFPTENQVPNHLLRHFVRGYFDGDGSIGNTTHIVSSMMFLNSLQNLLNKMGIESKISNMACNSITKDLAMNKKLSAIKFLDWIYQDSTIYLNRKYDKYLEWKEKYKNFNGRKRRLN